MQRQPIEIKSTDYWVKVVTMLQQNWTLEEIIERVCGKFDLSLTELTSQTRAQRVANARSIICHIAFACGHRCVEIARRLGITGSGVTVAAQRGKKTISEHPDLLTLMNDPG